MTTKVKLGNSLTPCLDRERVVEVVVVVVVSLLPEVDRVERDSSRTRRVIGPAPSMCRSSTMEVSELSARYIICNIIQYRVTGDLTVDT